jgi:hypothetical protein
MTVAPNPFLAGSDACTPPLLPSREAVMAHLSERLPGTRSSAATLVAIGLRVPDDQPSGLAQVTSVLAGSLRADDWLGGLNPGEFAVVMSGAATGAQTAAERLIAAVARLGIAGLSAAAGVAPLTADLDPAEAIRRATVSLTAARRAGAGTVVQHRQPY